MSAFSCCCDWGFDWIVGSTEIIDDIFAYGGITTFAPIATNVGYNIVGDSWSGKNSMSVAHGNFRGVALGGEAYAQCGYNASGVEIATNESYNAGTNAWSGKTAAAFARANCASMEIGGLGYLCGGQTSGATFIDDVDEYDASGNSWTARTALPSARSNRPATTGFNSDLGYSIGGALGGGLFAGNDEYSRSGDAWTARTEPTTNDDWSAVCELIGFLFFQALDASRTVEKYDQSGDSWSTVTSYPTPARSAAEMVSANGTGYLVGGSGVADLDSYDPAGDSWASLTSLPANRGFHGAAGL